MSTKSVFDLPMVCLREVSGLETETSGFVRARDEMVVTAFAVELRLRVKAFGRRIWAVHDRVLDQFLTLPVRVANDSRDHAGEARIEHRRRRGALATTCFLICCCSFLVY